MLKKSNLPIRLFFREWAKLVVIALGDEPTFDYDYDGVPGKIEDLRKQLAETEAPISTNS